MLVVDDEEPILELAEDLFTSCGCRVARAGDGPGAQERMQALAGKVDLVVFDMMLPDALGCEVFSWLRKLQPGLKGVVATGCDRDAVRDVLKMEGVVGRLDKPFDLAEVERIARGHLRRGRWFGEVPGAWRQEGQGNAFGMSLAPALRMWRQGDAGSMPPHAAGA